MKVVGILPNNDPEKILWAGNFIQKFTIHGPALNFSDAEIAAVVADLNFYLWLLQVWNPAIKNLTKEAATYHLHMTKGTGEMEATLPTLPTFTDCPAQPPPGLQDRLFATINRIKFSPGYNEQVIGQELRIIRAPAAVGSNEREYPMFTLATEQGPNNKHVRIEFKKHGHDGVAIDSRTNGGEWSFLAVDNSKPHIDDRPLRVPKAPEIREYRLRWWDKGKAHGSWSPAQSVSVTE